MGFFNLFKKEKKEENKEQDIKPPTETNLEPLDSTTTSVDENASFEIPDFSEEDLDFDLGIEDFLPEEKPMLDEEVEKPLSEHNQFRDFFQFEGGQELEVDNNNKSAKDANLADEESNKEQDLPSFSVEKEDFDLPEIEIESKEELPVFEVEQKSQNNTQQPIVFLERHHYADIIDLQSNIKFEVLNQIDLMNESKKASEIELNIYEDVKEQLDSIQHSLLYMDKKLFG